MLTDLSRRLTALSNEPICALLASCILPAWRNSTAHELVSWDPVRQLVDLDGELVETEAIVGEAQRAREICQAFETGVAVAMWEAGNPNAGLDSNNEVGLTMSTMMALGDAGIVVHKYRRAGDTVRLTVPTMAISSLPWFLVALVRASVHLEGVERWEVLQQDEGRPPLVISAAAIAETIGCAVFNENGDKVIGSGVSPLPMIADALFSHGAGVGAVVNTVIALASSQVVGEHQRLRVGSGASGAGEWSATVAEAERAIEATLRLVDDSGRDLLDSYLRVLRRARESGDVGELMVALRSAQPAQLPWIDARG